MTPPLIAPIGTVPFSVKKGLSIVTSQVKYSAAVIETLKNLLVSNGWNLTDSTPSTVTVFYPTGFPFSSGGSGSAGCGATAIVIVTQFSRYVFSPYSPGQTPVGIGCFQFPLGLTPAASLANLATSITANTPYNATLTTIGGVLAIVLQNKTVGPIGNFDTIFADGRFGVTDGTMFGGGYTLASVGSSPYTVTLTGIFGFGSEQRVGFHFELGPTSHIGPADYSITAQGIDQYTMVANPYSFVVFHNDSDVFNSIAAFATCITTNEGFTFAYSAFVVGPGNLLNQLLWGGGPEGQPNTQSLDTNPITMGDNRRGPGILSLRSTPGIPMVTLNKQPIVTAAYAMMSKDDVTEPFITGKLWDIINLSKFSIVGSLYSFGGRNFICVASSAINSLFFCINDNGQPTAGLDNFTDTGGSGGGGGDSPSDPSAPPATGNGSYSGTCTCTGSPNNHTIKWASGDKFASPMAGQSITITLYGLAHPWVSAGGSGDADGTLPVIATVIDATTLTTTADLNSSFYSAPYTSP